MSHLEDMTEGYILDRQTGKLIQAKTENDPVNKPRHYRFGDYELIDVIDALLLDGGFSPTEAFYVMTILQYIIRSPRKNGLQDDLKAKYYLDRLIEIKNRNLEEE